MGVAYSCNYSFPLLEVLRSETESSPENTIQYSVAGITIKRRIIVGCHRVTQSGDPSPGMRIPSPGMRIPDPIVGSRMHGRAQHQSGASMSEGHRALGRPRTPSRYHTRLSKRYTTHQAADTHGSQGWLPTGHPTHRCSRRTFSQQEVSASAAYPTGATLVVRATRSLPLASLPPSCFHACFHRRVRGRPWFAATLEKARKTGRGGNIK